VSFRVVTTFRLQKKSPWGHRGEGVRGDMGSVGELHWWRAESKRESTQVRDMWLKVVGGGGRIT